MTPSENTRRRVLVVDDNELVADTTVMVLLSFGFTAVAVYDPEKGLEMSKSGMFDLLLTDVTMSGMSGIELAIQVREGGYIPRILLMSGVVPTTADLLEDAHDRGYDFEFLAKPATPSELIDIIRRLLA